VTEHNHEHSEAEVHGNAPAEVVEPHDHPH
jgi:hypothetical protein